MKAEAEEEAASAGRSRHGPARGAGVEPEQVDAQGREGRRDVGLIEEDEDIAILVLAAGTGKEGPGPLVAGIGGKGAGDSQFRSRSCPGI